MEADIKKRYLQWCEGACFDDDTKKELLGIADDEKEITERFYKDLEFGTAGLRGITGAGTNRMNIYTVRRATQGLANHILKSGDKKNGVAIAYDSRIFSPEFAAETACTLAANGITAHLFESLRPTPELSFAVRYLNCVAGVNITASHNPSNYNGYKVYWADGAQITPPHDTGIMSEVKALTDFDTLKSMPQKEAEEKGLIRIIGSEVDDAYIAELKKLVLHPEAISACGDKIKVVYSPLHGTGNIPVRRILSELGFTNVYVVPEQEKPDGNFPTVAYPNPEAAEAFELAMKLAKEVDADIVLLTDPDADRLGVRIKDEKNGGYVELSGNVSGSLLADYEIGQKKALGLLPDDGVLITTIVSTNMAKAIAAYYGVGYIEVLTGFKHIGRKMLEFETEGTGSYLFGFEESYGCLIGTHARDKDAVVASMALCEAAAYYRSKGMSLLDACMDMYARIGFYREGVESVTLQGKEGGEKIAAIMNGLRADAPSELFGLKVRAVRDYESGIITDCETKETSPTGLPVSNVLYFDLENDAWVCIRPSGTEPKIKFYFGIRGDSMEGSGKTAAEFKEKLLSFVKELTK